MAITVIPERKHCVCVRDVILRRPGEFRIFVISGEGRDTEGIALLHRLGVLRRGELIPTRLSGDSGSGVYPRRCGVADRVGVKADPVCNPARLRAAVPEMDRDRFIGMPRHDPYWTIYCTSAKSDLNYVSGRNSVALG